MKSKLVQRLVLVLLGAVAVGFSPKAVAGLNPQGPGNVVTWGWYGAGFATNAPTAVTSGVTAVSGGSAHVLALQQGRVIAWGSDGDGQTDVVAAASSGVTAISAGSFYSLALKNGLVLAWGRNSSGQCDVPAAAQSGVAAIAAGADVSLALKNGQVLAWGAPGGAGSLNVPASAASGVTAIALGDGNGMALKNGQVIVWGNNMYGESNVPPAAQSGVSAIASGVNHCLALKNGQVIAWGRNNFGQTNVPVEAQSGVTAIAASSSSSVSMALKNGHVVVWGDNTSHQTNAPAAVLGSNVVGLTGGGMMCAAITGNYARIYWQNPAGTVAEWTVTPDGMPFASRVIAEVGNDWKLKTVSDITGDGVEDLLWQRSSDNALASWFMNLDGTIHNTIFWGSLPLWELKSSGNFNGDQQCDLFFQKADGTAAVWTVDQGGSITAAQLLGNQGDWKLKAVGDLNHDNLAEVYFQNSSAAVVAWSPTSPWLPPFAGLMPLTVLSFGATPGWELRAAGDLDGDGVADLLWQTPSGTAACWFMNADGSVRSVLVLGEAGTWRLVGVANKH